MNRKQTGDTIVEVMIAIVVISTVLAGAFVLSRTSLKHVRDSEEHGQALKLLQGQFEQLRSAVSAGAASPGSNFCFDNTDTANVPKVAPCTYGTDAAYDSSGNGLYKIKLSDNGVSGVGTRTFIGTISWDSINGGTAQEQLSYRLDTP